MVNLVCNQLGWAIPWYLDDYMSLNSTHEKVCYERLNRYLALHRKTQMPECGAFLEQIVTDIEAGMTPLSVHRIQERTRQMGQVLIERLVSDMVELFLHASDQQVYLKVSEKERRKRRANDIESYAER